MKVLVNCYACSPYQGSEPGMGWNFVKCLSRLHVLHIITELKFKADLDRYFEEHPEDKPFFQFYFIEKNRHKKLRKIWPPSYYWFYKAWQKKAYKLAMTLDEKENFDIIHQLNIGSQDIYGNWISFLSGGLLEVLGLRRGGCFHQWA